MARSKTAKDIGEKIRSAREQKGLSVQQLGDLVGLSDQQIRRIEHGGSDITAITLARIAKATGQDVRGFLSKIPTIQEQAEFLWKRHKLGRQLPGSKDADFKAKKTILESMGLWEE